MPRRLVRRDIPAAYAVSRDALHTLADVLPVIPLVECVFLSFDVCKDKQCSVTIDPHRKSSSCTRRPDRHKMSGKTAWVLLYPVRRMELQWLVGACQTKSTLECPALFTA